MPEIRTIVSDLYHNRSKRVLGAGTLGARGPQQEKVLSAMYRVKELSTPIEITVGADFSFNMAAVQMNAANGHYLFFEDTWSTVATITRAQRIVPGGGYSGCLYSVYNAGNGVYKCVHTARPAGTMSDDYVRGLRAYARDKRWTLVHEVPTAGGAGRNGCVTTFLLTRVSYTISPIPVVRTVRLRQDANGFSVERDRFQDAR